jgi:uncharacterized protein YcbK (DUF882 family)
LLRTRFRSIVANRKAVAKAGFLAGIIAALAPSTTQTAVANGDTRTIYLYHAHTKESIAATFRVGGSYDSAALKQLNWFLRDWRRDEPTSMDPRLFDTVWEVYRTAGATSPVWVVSAYRSPETNSMLRRRSRAVAKHSQHMLGKAMDTHMPGLSMARVREIGVKLQRGGVGWYPTAGTPFVHLDVGSVRAWPRLSYDHLARLFPDGKTVHVPSSGGPLPGYEQARAEIEARGGQAYDIAEVTGKSKGFFASLFGGGEEEEEIAAPTTRGRVGRTPSRGRSVAVAAYAPQGGDALGEDGGRNFFVASNESRPEPVVRAERNLPRGETYLQPAPVALKPTPVEEPARPDPRARTQVASLAPVAPPAAESVALDMKKFGDLAPLPPRRPSDLAAPAFADAPLPPARPVRLAALGDVSATPGFAPRGLPALIANGGARGEPARLPPAALAYAAAAAPSPPQRPAVATLAKAAPVGSTTAAAPDSPRLDRANYRSLTSTGPAQASLAPPVAGLRRAARAGAREASATGWSSQFGSSDDILPSGAFTGVAGE